VTGTFKPLSRYEYMSGYEQWRAHADSISTGALKPQNLDLKYVLGDESKCCSGCYLDPDIDTSKKSSKLPWVILGVVAGALTVGGVLILN